MAEITIDELMRKQEELVKVMRTLEGETDTDRIMQVGERLQQQARELEEMARELEREQMAKAKTIGRTEVVLTPDQRKRILEQTGVEMESLMLLDVSGLTSKTMPRTNPELIEAWALEEAKRKKVSEQVGQTVDAELAVAVADLEATGTPGVIEKLEELKRDPNFLAGKLKPR